mgnify:CR=1 FL=1
MALFQNTIIKTYAPRYQKEIDSAYTVFKKYFSDIEVQENIRKSKEEQFQEGFLRELFVNVLGYTLNPAPSFNLITEQKNVTDAKKADGAILVNDEVVGVIELKDLKTVDLKKIEDQVFKYRRNHRNARYVVTSNFEKLRFYIDNAVDYEEFNLFELTLERFTLLWLCLACENIKSGLPLQMKLESVSSEDKITKQLYKEYSEFKRQLFSNLEHLNPQYDRLTLFKKSQKLLDRFLFILFAEDSGLLPANSIVDILNQWHKLKELDEYRPLYERFKKYFGYMNTGHKGKRHEIFAYNGGLFQPDEILDNILIDDNVLEEHLVKISRYDFASEVDVNILGHIFENSLTEIEKVANAIEDDTIAIQTSKRKKDGVFYTPRYITTYIVENTVGKLCNDKKQELGLDQLEYFDDAKKKRLTKQQKDRAKEYGEKIDAYRKWLLTLTICDPACGSGAFLNAALDYLIAEHRLVDEMESKVFRATMVFSEVENAILENNLFGVDINEESVEIAKLSLWLRTAKPYRKLNSLSNNIKCGNSLIDDPKVAGEKAFYWEKEFPHIFEKGGFDVVIGNPPYGAFFNSVEIQYFNGKYFHQNYQLDSYLLFTEKIHFWVKNHGFLGYIMPNTWLSLLFGEKIRTYVFEQLTIKKIVHYDYFVFQDATVETDIYIFQNTKPLDDSFFEIDISGKEGIQTTRKIEQKDWIELKGAPVNIYETKEIARIKKKISKLHRLEYYTQIVQGTKPFQLGKGNPTQNKEIMDSKPFVSDRQENETFRPLLRGSLINRYQNYWNQDYWISYGDWLAEPRYSAKFESSQKLVIRQTGDSLIATFDEKQFIARDNLYIIRDDNGRISLKGLLGIINSTFLTWYYRNVINPEIGKAMAQVKRGHLLQLPIPSPKSIGLDHHVTQMLSLNTDLYAKRQRFIKRLADNFEGIKMTRALESFDEGDFKQFLAELKKQKMTLTLVQQDEWEDYFNQYKRECNTISATIATTDYEIDQMVYKLYKLTDEEIAIVEGKN